MEENFGMEWKMFSMKWKWNGRKLPVQNMEKSCSIPFHTMPCLNNAVRRFCDVTNLTYAFMIEY